MGNITQNWVNVLFPFSKRYDLKLTAREYLQGREII